MIDSKGIIKFVKNAGYTYQRTYSEKITKPRQKIDVNHRLKFLRVGDYPTAEALAAIA